MIRFFVVFLSSFLTFLLTQNFNLKFIKNLQNLCTNPHPNKSKTSPTFCSRFAIVLMRMWSLVYKFCLHSFAEAFFNFYSDDFPNIAPSVSCIPAIDVIFSYYTTAQILLSYAPNSQYPQAYNNRSPPASMSSKAFLHIYYQSIFLYDCLLYTSDAADE